MGEKRMMCSALSYNGSWPRDCSREAVEDGLCRAHFVGRKRSQEAAKKRAEQFKKDSAARVAAFLDRDKGKRAVRVLERLRAEIADGGPTWIALMMEPFHTADIQHALTTVLGTIDRLETEEGLPR